MSTGVLGAIPWGIMFLRDAAASFPFLFSPSQLFARKSMFRTGEYVPWFVMQTTTGAKFELQAQGGRFVVLCFFESTVSLFGRRVLDDIERHGERFHGEGVTSIGVSIDPSDANLQPTREQGTYF